MSIFEIWDSLNDDVFDLILKKNIFNKYLTIITTRVHNKFLEPIAYLIMRMFIFWSVKLDLGFQNNAIAQFQILHV